MPKTPAVNPNVHDIADKIKHEHVRVTGLLHADEALNLQDELFLIWENVCAATLFAVVPDDADWEGDWDTLAEGWNTYSDGRTVVTRIRIEPPPHTDPNSARNQQDNTYLHLCDTGDEGVIYCVAQPNPADDELVDDAPRQPAP